MIQSMEYRALSLILFVAASLSNLNGAVAADASVADANAQKPAGKPAKLTREQIIELMIQLSVYRGFPSALNAFSVAQSVFALGVQPLHLDIPAPVEPGSAACDAKNTIAPSLPRSSGRNARDV